MSESQKTNVDANKRDFTRGVEAGLNSEDTKFWHAGYELGQELSDRKTKELVQPVIHQESDTPVIHQEPETPLFLRDTSDGKKDDPQDEKDKSAE